MFTGVLSRVVVAAGVLVSAAVTVLPAQAPSGSAHPGAAELLAEVRALRAEVNQAAGASMRMQLLLARLTLQEQRISTLGRETVEIQNELLAASRERSEAQARLQHVEEIRDRGTLPPDDQRGFAHEAKMLADKVSEQVASEQHLRSREADLLAALTAEQGRWMEFNARLDELERALPAASR